MAGWADRNPDRIVALRAYLAGYGDWKPSVLEWFAGGRHPVFDFAADSDRGSALLLSFCALYQGISEKRLMETLAGLWQAYGSDFLRLNRLPFAALNGHFESLPELDRWAIRKQAPGILRSVCDFFYRHGSPLAWVRGMADAEASVKILSDEIFLMGRTTVFKSKARYFLWLLACLPEVRPGEFWTEATQLPPTPGHMRLLREVGPLKGRRSSPWQGPAEKLAYVNRFFRLLAPDAPWTAYGPLDAYLRPVASPGPHDRSRAPAELECRRVLGGCSQCPLAAWCPERREP